MHFWTSTYIDFLYKKKEKKEKKEKEKVGYSWPEYQAQYMVLCK